MTESNHEAREAQFNRLLAQNLPALRRLAASYARMVSDREDLVQEIALALWRALPAFRGDCSERTFLFRIAHNRCITIYRKRRTLVPLDDVAEELADPAATSEVALAEAQRRQQLARAVQRLPLSHREVILLSLEGLNYEEISAVVGISETNVGARLSRARQQLKKLLREAS